MSRTRRPRTPRLRRIGSPRSRGAVESGSRPGLSLSPAQNAGFYHPGLDERLPGAYLVRHRAGRPGTLPERQSVMSKRAALVCALALAGLPAMGEEKKPVRVYTNEDLERMAPL